MTTEQKELFQTAILRVLDANRSRWGQGVVAIGLRLAQFAFSAASFASEEAFHAAIADAVQYLCDKQLAEEVPKVVGAANRVWRITPAGIDYLDEHG
jgi:hypothetical protein